MELWLKNIGVIKDSSVIIDGLTVITGKNSSGKTTVGKALYAVIQANNNIEYAFEQAKNEYIRLQFEKIWNALTARRVYAARSRFPEHPLNETEKMLYILSHRYFNIPLDQLLSWLSQTKDVLPRLTIQELRSFLKKAFIQVSNDNEYMQTLAEQFAQRKESAIDICNRAFTTVCDDKAFPVFRFDRVKAYLNSVFHNQIKPVKAPQKRAHLCLSDSGRTIVDINIRSKITFEFSIDSSFVFPFNQAVFIDNPFVLDRIENDENYFKFSTREQDGDSISVTEFPTPEEHLLRLLTTKATGGFFDKLEFQNEYRSVFEKINQIVPGEFQESNEGFFYLDNGARLNVQNLATGSKLFSIIKLLFINGYLSKDTILVLDEPESHLHPEWINKFAEILVLLIKEVKLRVLLTTHSPNLLLALNVFSKDYGESAKSHFYLANTNENDWTADLHCIDEDIGEGYAHLSIPLIEMSIQQDSFSEE